MSQLLQGIGGLSTSVPTATNPFQAFPITTASSAFGDLSSIGLDPTEQALVDFLGGQQDTRTRDIYARLGLGGSTMETQDLGANELQRIAESANLIQANRGQAIQEQSTLGNLIQNEAQLATQAGLQTQQLNLNAANAANRNFTTALGNIGGGLTSIAQNAGFATA